LALMQRGDLRLAGAEAGIQNVEERDGAFRRRNRSHDDLFVRPRGAQAFRIAADGLDMHAPPASLVEGAADGIDGRIVRPYVDIEALRHMLEGRPEQHILKILGVGDEHQASILSTVNSASSQELPMKNGCSALTTSKT